MSVGLEGEGDQVGDTDEVSSTVVRSIWGLNPRNQLHIVNNEKTYSFVLSNVSLFKN